jgi:NAD(P)-dependent dehydrogenase (short-subunit alcohol dehydrogenase family)
MSEATVPRFGAGSTALEVIAGHDLCGREAIVTGGASGIGVETVRALAVAGARVTLAARNRAQAQEVAASLAIESGEHIAESGGAIDVRTLDLASLSSVRAFTADVLTGERPLHILINNAGVMATPQSYTEDGFELQFGTNHVGHFALTTGLMPALLKAAGTARVVSLSSIGHRRSDVHFDDVNFRERPYDPWAAYGQSKTANALFAVGLTQRYAGDGITSNAVMPGGIMTGLQKHLTRDEQMAMGWFDEHGTPNPRFKSTAQGAATSIWAAVAPELAGKGGLYLEDCAVAKPWTSEQPMSGYMPYALDPANAGRLWTLSEEMLISS